MSGGTLTTAIFQLGKNRGAAVEKCPSALFEGTAPSASLDHPKARTAPMHPRTKPEPLGSLPRPQEPRSGRPKVENSPLSTTRYYGFVFVAIEGCSFCWACKRTFGLLITQPAQARTSR